MSLNSAAVILGTFDSTTKTFGVSILGGEGRDLDTVDENILGVVLRGIVEHVYTFHVRLLIIQIMGLITMHRHFITWFSSLARGLDWSLGVCCLTY